MTMDYGFSYHWAVRDTQARVDAVMGGIAALKAVRVRTGAAWPLIQPTDSTHYDWTGTDYAVNKALELGLAPLLLLSGRPSWGPNATNFGTFAGQCATRYGAGGTALSPVNVVANRHVRDFELWNEENQYVFWGVSPVSPTDYTAYLQAGYTAIKAVMPGTLSTVLLGGLQPTGDGGTLGAYLAMKPSNFLTQMYAAGAHGYFDAVADHPYTITTEDPPSEAPSTTSTYIVEADAVYAVMVANGDGGKKIWSTEAGWAAPTKVTESQQAQYWSDWVAIWQTKPYAGPWICYEYADEGTDPTDPEMHFGIVNNDLTTKQAWAFFNGLNANASTPPSQPPDWVTQVPNAPIHQEPASDVQGVPTNAAAALCQALIGNNPLLGSLVALGGGGAGGTAGSLVGGTQTLADMLCGMITGTPSKGTTAQSLLGGATDVSTAVNTNPFASGLLGMGGGSGNLAIDGINGTQSFANSLFSLLGLCGCGSQYDPSAVTPQDVISGATDVSGAVSSNPFAMGLLGLGQQGGSSGNAAVDGINGVQSFANSLFSLLGICGCGSQYDPTATTPQDVLSGATDVSTAVTTTPFLIGLLGLGQQNGSSGNAIVDGINGGQSFANSLFSLLSLCGCGTQYDPTATTPQDVISGASDVSGALSNNPFIMGLLGLGQQGGGSGNLAVDGINGTQSFANSLFGVLGSCGACGSQYNPSAVTPQNVITGANSITTAVGNNPLFNALTGNLFLDVANSVTAAADTVGGVSGTSTTDLYNRFQYLQPYTGGYFTNGLYGLLAPQLLPTISTGSVALSTPNYLINATFDTAISMAPEYGWSWANIVGHNGVGAAEVVADGNLRELLSNEIYVTNGEGLTLKAWAKWDSISYTGTDPIVLGVTKYQNRIEVGSEDLDTLISPAATGDWSELSSDYVVPSSVDEVRLRLKIAPTLASGTVYFDDATVQKNDLIGDHLVPGVGNSLDNTVQALYGWSGGGFTHPQEYQAMLSLAAATTANSAQIAALLALQTTGVIATDDFKRTGSTLGSNWTTIATWGAGGGTEQVNGEEAYWVTSGLNPRGEIWRWQGDGDTSGTDSQKITVVLGTAPQELHYHQDGYWYFIWVPPVDTYTYGANYVCGRMDAADNNRIEGVVRADGYCAINRVLATVRTELANTIIANAPGTGSSVSLVCGTAAGPRYFELLVNNVTVLTANDSTSNYGSSYRHWGAGAYADTGIDSFFPAQALPGNINSWFAQDQT